MSYMCGGRIKRCVKREATYLSAGEEEVKPAKPGCQPGGKVRRLMRKDIAVTGTESIIPTFEVLESLVWEQAQSFIQRILEEEVTELLGRVKSERIEGVDSPKGYRNGQGKPRKLTMSSGTITVWRPRVALVHGS